MEKVDIVKEFVTKAALSSNNYYGEQSFTHHILTVVNIIDQNYEKYNANKEIVLIAGYLHDYASIISKDYTPDHHIIGVGYAYDILKSTLGLALSNDELMLIMDCIYNHRGSVPHEKLTPEEKCVADSDALAHLFEVPSIFRLAYSIKGFNENHGTSFILDKLSNSYNKLSLIGVSLAKEQYEACQKVIISKPHPLHFDSSSYLAYQFNLPHLMYEQYGNLDADVDEGADNVLKHLKDVYDSLDHNQQLKISDHLGCIQKVISRKYKS